MAERLEGEQVQEHVEHLDDDWQVVDGHHLKREFDFDDFQAALDFVNTVGEVAEEMNHHPNIELTWGEATIKIYSHDIDGLSERDFELAGRLDELY